MSTISSVFSELGRLIDQVSKDRGIEKQKVIDSVLSGMLSAARKKYGTYRNIEAKYNEENGQLELYEFKEVVEDQNFVDEQIEIKLSEALKMDPEARTKDQIGIPLKSEELGRIDAYTARQIVVQNLKDAENEMIFNEFEKRKGEVVSGVVRREDRRVIVVDLDKVEAYIPKQEQIFGEKYNPGDRIQGYILEVRQNNRGPQIIMSRAHPNYLIKLFEKEVPEIYEGIIKIVSAAREPGHRAKIAVYSNDSAVHPVGACVGMKGNRVQNITQELKGERIDVIVWDEDPVRFVCNALAPAKIMKVLVDDESKEMEVVVADDQLSLAIGKKGQNVRLAVNLTKWHLNIMSFTEFEEKKRQTIFNLKLLPDMTTTMAENICQCGVSSFQDLASTSLERVMLIPGYDTKEKAGNLIQTAKELVKKYKGQKIPTAPEIEKEQTKAGQKTEAVSAKAQADKLLKEELAQLEQTDQPKTKKEADKKSEPVKKEADKKAEPANKEAEKDSKKEGEASASTDEAKKEAKPVKKEADKKAEPANKEAEKESNKEGEVSASTDEANKTANKEAKPVKKEVNKEAEKDSNKDGEVSASTDEAKKEANKEADKKEEVKTKPIDTK